MKLILNKKPKKVRILEGFPGFGLVGSITTEFLIDHLKCEKIGKISAEDSPPIVAIHEEVIEPYGIFYNKKYNLVILHAINSPNGLEWKFAEIVKEMANKLDAKEIISIEGVGTNKPSDELEAFFYTKNPSFEKKFKKIGLKKLREGIIIGVTGALLLSIDNVPLSCIFVEAHSQLPDSKAAAKMIEVLDKYLKLKVDYKPLLKQAEKFEEKLKELLLKSQEANEIQEKKQLSYVG